MRVDLARQIEAKLRAFDKVVRVLRASLVRATRQHLPRREGGPGLVI